MNEDRTGWSDTRRRERNKYRDREIYCSWGRHRVLPAAHITESFPEGTMCLECQVKIAAGLSETLAWNGLTSQLTDLERIRLTRENDAKKTAKRIKAGSDEEGFVYYMRMNGRIKIGHTGNVEKRSRSYPPGSELLAVEPGSRKTERTRHQEFAASLAEGREWFTETPRLTAHMAAIAERHGNPAALLHQFTKATAGGRR